MLLKTVKGVTDAVFHRILNKRGTLKGIFSASFDELYSMGIPSITAENVVNRRYNEAFADGELSAAEKNGVRIIGIENEDYPPLLKEIYCPPAYFYAKGKVGCLKKPAIAIVGSRKASKAGAELAGRIAADLASVGVTVVSGFAVGIDIAAHIGAASKGSTAAVLGSGMFNVYPKSSVKYAGDIIKEGCVITEYPFAEMPLPYNFPKRNRIISGLSLGVLIAEASRRSGSLITAHFALEQNRAVFAVPHFPGAMNSAGNDLLKQGAKPAESYLDIIEEFKNIFNASIKEEKPESRRDTPGGLNGRIYEAVKKEPLSADELCETLNVGVVDIMVAAAELEIEGYITKNEAGDFIPRSGVSNG